ncbi:peptidylprolyl isomerase [Porphyromonas macacae]|uniref:Peptidylprolyl isomerase n=1 Tax=Porphyromonas macacae TaxID=28115 RepID=A0A0A2E7Z4_9PORP|nr:peptidylprolyl isomerase [Porphyromonas macacae]KGN75018.1 peptidylprolyl isomerase [Porphyromonas macacae]
MKRILYSAFMLFISLVSSHTVSAQRNIADEVVWMVGDEPILKSDIEFQKLRMKSSGMQIKGNPDCFIPEQIAVQKLFLNQAKIDSIEVDDKMVNIYVERWIEDVINQVGSKQKLEEYFNKNLSQIREDERREAKNGEIVRMMQQKIAENVRVSPSEIRRYYRDIPQDSLPYIPTTVEVQVIKLRPTIALSEIDAIKKKLRGWSEEVNTGKRDFSTIARLYSDDKRTAMQGGEYGFVSRAALDEKFASVVFNMSDKKRVSPIIETDEGFFIAQLVEKKGDLINFRQILLRPHIAETALVAAENRLDSIRTLIVDEKMKFGEASLLFSDDDNTRNNSGLMVNTNRESSFYSSSNFKMEELPQEISREVDKLKVDEISKPFRMTNDKGLEEVAFVKLKFRTEGHKADLNRDFRTIKNMALADKREKVLDEWVREKQKDTYIFINEQYRNCDFKYPDWVH